jgi:hypothetical protein
MMTAAPNGTDRVKDRFRREMSRGRGDGVAGRATERISATRFFHQRRTAATMDGTVNAASAG